MPNNIIQQPVYFDPNLAVPSLYYPGNLGCRFTYNNQIGQAPGVGPIAAVGGSGSYQIVQYDSGLSTSATRGMVAWWKNLNSYVVTIAQTSAINRNMVAGIFPCTVSPGYYTAVQYGGPAYVQVTLASVGAVTSGDSLIPSAADNGQADRVASGTAPTYVKIGTAAGTTVATNLILTDLSLSESAAT